MIPVATTVLILIVAGAIAFMLLRGGGPSSAAPPGTDTPSAMSSQPTATPEPSVPEASQPVAGAAFTCWNGKTAETIGDCGPATGIEGLKFIYPSLVAQWDRCEYMDYRPTTATYDCRFEEGVIRYRYWKDTAEAGKHYSAKYAKADRTELVLDGQAVGTLYRATKRDKNGVFTMTAQWGGGHYSLSVEAGSRAAQESLWNTVSFRAIADLNGYPTGQEPGEAERG